MASLGIRKFQDLVGRTDFLQVRESGTAKTADLDFSMILKSALSLRPGTNIVGVLGDRSFPRLVFSPLGLFLARSFPRRFFTRPFFYSFVFL